MDHSSVTDSTLTGFNDSPRSLAFHAHTIDEPFDDLSEDLINEPYDDMTGDADRASVQREDPMEDVLDVERTVEVRREVDPPRDPIPRDLVEFANKAGFGARARAYLFGEPAQRIVKELPISDKRQRDWFLWRMSIHKELGGRSPCKCIKLHCYQDAIARWFTNRHNTGSGLLVAMGTGTGKTLVAIDTAERMRQTGLVDDIVVVTSAKQGRIFWDDIRACHYSGTEYCKGEPAVDIDTARKAFPFYHVTTFDKIADFSSYFPKIRLSESLVIFDEAHHLRGESPGSNETEIKRYRYAVALAKRARFVLALTATPMIKNSHGLVFLANLIWRGNPPPGVLESKYKFWQESYGDLREGSRAWHLLARVFRNRVASCQPSMFEDDRYKCTDAKEWPASTFKRVYVDLGASAKTRKLVDASVNAKGDPKTGLQQLIDLGDTQPTEEKVQMSSTLKAYMSIIYNSSAMPKAKEIADRIRVAVKVGRYPVCVYSQFAYYALRLVLDLLKGEMTVLCLGPTEHLGGITTIRARNRLLKRINRPLRWREHADFQVLLLHPAFAEGITLCRFREMHIFEQQLDYGPIMQARGRLIRIRTHIELSSRNRRIDIYEYIGCIDRVIFPTYDVDYSPEQYICNVAMNRERQRKVWDVFLKKMSITMCPAIDAYKPKYGDIAVRGMMNHRYLREAPRKKGVSQLECIYGKEGARVWREWSMKVNPAAKLVAARNKLVKEAEDAGRLYSKDDKRVIDRYHATKNPPPCLKRTFERIIQRNVEAGCADDDDTEGWQARIYAMHQRHGRKVNRWYRRQEEIDAYDKGVGDELDQYKERERARKRGDYEVVERLEQKDIRNKAEIKKERWKAIKGNLAAAGNYYERYQDARLKRQKMEVLAQTKRDKADLRDAKKIQKAWEKDEKIRSTPIQMDIDEDWAPLDLTGYVGVSDGSDTAETETDSVVAANMQREAEMVVAGCKNEDDDDDGFGDREVWSE